MSIPDSRKMIILVAVLMLGLSISTDAAELSPNLQRATAFGPADSLVGVVVFLEDSDIARTVFKFSQRPDLNRGQRLKGIVNQLKSYSPNNERGILNFLAAHAVGPVKRHWVTPAFTAILPLSRIVSLSQMEGVKTIVENAVLTYEPPVDISPVLTTATETVSGQLSTLGVPELWSRGLKGKGRLVCSFDTGVEQSHPALRAKWRGNRASLKSSWFSPIAPDTLPYDLVGHGTHTMGIMVGSADADSFGVAPEAEWITAGVIDQGRTISATISDIIEAFQWSLNPDGDESTIDDVPDVILNSWGFPKGMFTPCDNTFWNMIDNVEAAGIVTIFSAGNEGPEPRTIRHPADRASTPINSFAVGAVDNSLLIASFSSRGPSSCDTSKTKPEVVAPGVNIRSSTKGGGYVLMSGTSMAAPYVAGLVALIRQYNSEATVEQIKYAFLQAADDLGPVGEDNAYGYGFIDASRVLDYIPTPRAEELKILSYLISDDGIAEPGETFGLQLVVSSSIPSLDYAIGTVVPSGLDGIVSGNNMAIFDFLASDGVALNDTPFDIYFDTNLYHGQPVSFRFVLSSPETSFEDTLELELYAGIKPAGASGTHDNGSLILTVSDYGQFGLATNSIYNAGGKGLCFDDSDNLLYEAGLLLGVGGDSPATSIRDEYGLMKITDFNPVRTLTEETVGADGGIHRTAAFTATVGANNITVNQQTTHFGTIDELGFLILEYQLTNTSFDRITDLRLGFFTDLDLSSYDEITLDVSSGLIYQTNRDGLYVGVASLNNIAAFKSMANGTGKAGFSSEQLSSMLADDVSDVSRDLSGDLMFLITSNSFLIDPRQSADFAVAIVVGHNVAELYNNVAKAKEKYQFMASFSGDESDMAEALRLYQNYPNPFNPTTTISFSVLQAGEVSLDVINILGQKVKNLYTGNLAVGLHRFEWDGTNIDGQRVASGVYFCRLHGESSSQSRKMILMK